MNPPPIQPDSELRALAGDKWRANPERARTALDRYQYRRWCAERHEAFDWDEFRRLWGATLAERPPSS